MSDITALAATTTLQAVNVMLKSIGESPISTLEGIGTEMGSEDAEAALETLMETSRRVQGLGWHFNKDIGFKLLPDPDTGFIRLPANTLRVDEVYPEDLQHGTDMVMRGLRLYDRRNHTYAIGRPVIADIVTMLAFEDLPQYARTYILISAARKFAEDETNSDSTSRFTKGDEEMALVAMEQMDAEHAGHNLGLHSPFIRTILSR